MLLYSAPPQATSATAAPPQPLPQPVPVQAAASSEQARSGSRRFFGPRRDAVLDRKLRDDYIASGGTARNGAGSRRRRRCLLEHCWQ